MATRCPFPDAVKIKTVLGLLFDGLDVKPGKKFEVLGGSWLGLYVDDGGIAVAACAMDLALSAYTCASLSMLPPAIAKEAIKTTVFSADMIANLGEVMNICSRFLINDVSPHLRLESVSFSKTLNFSTAAFLKSVEGRVDFELSLPRYGSGSMSLVSL